MTNTDNNKHWYPRALVSEQEATPFLLYLDRRKIPPTIWGIYIPFSGASQVALVVKNLPANAGDVSDMGSIPGSRRSPGGGNDNPLQNSCQDNSIDRRVWRATVREAAKSQRQLSTYTRTKPLVYA